MKFIIQRVTGASVSVAGDTIGEIKNGYVVLVGIKDSDNVEIADRLVDKMVKLRIFEDDNGKTNISLSDVGGSILIISQFTLYADCKKGNRPSFIKAGKPDMANELYEYITGLCRERGFDVQTGIFGADMKVSLVNDGPFTIILDSDEILS